jgi:transcriptional regulator with XRE-family HTH domain
MDLGKAIKAIRTARGLTQKELAQRADLSVSYFSLLETNKRDPSISTIESIAQALNVPVSIMIFLAADRRELDVIDQGFVEKMSYAIYELIHVNPEQQSFL